MKMPLWAKGRDGKWHRFPYEALVTLPNGEVGFYVFSQYSNPIKRDIMLKFLEETDWDVHHFFRYSESIHAYVLKDTREEKS